MKIERILYLTPALVLQIMVLARKVKGAPFTAEEYAEYISRNFDKLGLFGCFEDEKLVSYIHAEPPHSWRVELDEREAASETGSEL